MRLFVGWRGQQRCEIAGEILHRNPLTLEDRNGTGESIDGDQLGYIFDLTLLKHDRAFEYLVERKHTSIEADGHARVDGPGYTDSRPAITRREHFVALLLLFVGDSIRLLRLEHQLRCLLALLTRQTLEVVQ